jgi:hypothetical protein
LITESATFGLEACETCYPFSRARTRARARQYDDDDDHEHGFDPPGVADTMIKTDDSVQRLMTPRWQAAVAGQHLGQ